MLDALTIGIDIGGTFTDIAIARQGQVVFVGKVLSTTPPTASFAAALDEGARALGITREDLVAKCVYLMYGTTVATNALLTRSGATTALITTKGLRDALEMAGGTRDEPFNNWMVAEAPLVRRPDRFEVSARVNRRGRRTEPLDGQEVIDIANTLRARQVKAVAVALIHSCVAPDDEEEILRILGEQLPGIYLSVSHRLVPHPGFDDRVRASVVDAYVGPLVREHLATIREFLAREGLRGAWLVMHSAGGVIAPEAAAEMAISTVLSGPAAAPIESARSLSVVGAASGISVDMGGTSFDVALIRNGVPDRVGRGKVGNCVISTRMLDITTVGAGGGSIAWIDPGGLLRVGPESSGSLPGPASYGLGGTAATVTDACVVLGMIGTESFSRSGLTLDQDAARGVIDASAAVPLGIGHIEAAAGIYRIVVANMVAGIRMVTVERGIDPRTLPLVVGGGAGPLHAVALARDLGIRRVIIPKFGSTLSAVGMLHSEVSQDIAEAVPFDCTSDEWDLQIEQILARLSARASEFLLKHGVDLSRAKMAFSADIRYRQQYHELEVPFGDVAGDKAWPVLHRRFDETHQERFGYSLPEEELEIVAVRVRSSAELEQQDGQGPTDGHEVLETPAALATQSRGIFDITTEMVVETPVYSADRGGALSDQRGPLVLELAHTSVVVPSKWRIQEEPDVFVVEFDA